MDDVEELEAALRACPRSGDDVCGPCAWRLAFSPSVPEPPPGTCALLTFVPPSRLARKPPAPRPMSTARTADDEGHCLERDAGCFQDDGEPLEVCTCACDGCQGAIARVLERQDAEGAAA